jgi:tetratricopeptide (TPR) repeat protein
MMRSLTAIFLVTGLAGVSFGQAPAGTANAPASDKAGAYYNFAMGRLYQELAAADGARSDYVAKAIQHYQDALKDDPSADMILEELTDLYIQTGHLRDAVTQANDLLAQNPDNLAARRMLGRIYTRMIGDPQRGRLNQDMLRQATEQYQKVTEKDPKDADSWVMLGRLYKLANNSVDAEKAYNQALQAEPDNEDALTNLAVLYAELGETQRAIEKLKAATEKNPSENTLANLATAYEQMSDYKDAAEVLKKALDIAPDNGRLRRALADDLLRSGQADQALAVFEQLANDNPRDVPVRLRLSQIYRHKREFAKAHEVINQAAKIEADNLEVQVEESRILADEGKIDDAIANLKNLVQQSARKSYSADEAATHAALLEELAGMYQNAGQYQSAIDALRQIGPLLAGSALPSNGDGGKQGAADDARKGAADETARVEAEIIQTYRLAKDFDAALREADAALKKYPGDRAITVMHAQVLVDRGKTDEAVSEIRGLLKGDRDRETLVTLAQIYENGKRYNDEAKTLDEVEKLSTTDNDKEQVNFLRGAMLERQKKYDASEAEFREALKLNPEDDSALNYLGYMLANRGVKLDEAAQLIQKALEISPDNGAYLDSLGWAYYQLGRLDEAEVPLLRALQKPETASDPTVHDHLGDLYLKMGKTKEAIAQWQASLKRYQTAAVSDQDPEDMAKITKKLENAKVRLAKETGSTR